MPSVITSMVFWWGGSWQDHRGQVPSCTNRLLFSRFERQVADLIRVFITMRSVGKEEALSWGLIPL
jgi:hypothetical protein